MLCFEGAFLALVMCTTVEVATASAAAAMELQINIPM